jgi:mono/diheme cytochrome c family protein
MKDLSPLLFGVFLALAGASAPQTRSKLDVKRGEQVYKTLCWTCHGNYGRGDGPAAQYLARTPPDFTDPRVLGQKSDQLLLSDLLGEKGGARASHRSMIIGEVLKREVLRDALGYLRTLSVPGKHVSIPAGKDIYNTFCWACHGTKGNGEGPAAKNLVGVRPRDFTSKDFVIEGREEEVRRTIFEGAAKTFHGSPYMPEWRTALSQQQILDVVEYLKTFRKNP